jgi:S1-C subfamily serine protease
MKLASAPETQPREEKLIAGNNPFAGATVANLSPRVADELHMPTDTAAGVVIEKLNDNSPAARLGFEPKDIIVSVNGAVITNTQNLEVVAGSDPDIWRVEIERDGQRIRQFFR